MQLLGETHLLLSSVGVPSVDHRDDDRENPRRSAHEESGDIAETKSSSKGGLTISYWSLLGMKKTYEEGVEAEPDDIGSQGEHENVNLSIFERHDQTVECTLLCGIDIGFSYILLHTHSRNEQLLLGESPGIGRQVRQDECG